MEIAAAVRLNQAAPWSRSEKEFHRTIDALQPLAVDGSIEALLTQVREYLKAGAACIQCVKSEDGEFTQLGQALTDRVGVLEEKLRARN